MTTFLLGLVSASHAQEFCSNLPSSWPDSDSFVWQPAMGMNGQFLTDPAFDASPDWDAVGGTVSNDQAATYFAYSDSRDSVFFRVRLAESPAEVTSDRWRAFSFHTLLEADEVLTEIRLAPQASNTGASYHKLKRKTGDFATAAAAAVIQMSGDTCQRARIALTNLAPTALRASDAEAVLTGQVITDDLIDQAAQKAMDACDPAEDLRGDVEYKTHMGGEMTRRAIRTAVERAKG